jgi:hypothetical protein
MKIHILVILNSWVVVSTWPVLHKSLFVAGPVDTHLVAIWAHRRWLAKTVLESTLESMCCFHFYYDVSSLLVSHELDWAAIDSRHHCPSHCLFDHWSLLTWSYELSINSLASSPLKLDCFSLSIIIFCSPSTTIESQPSVHNNHPEGTHADRY